MIKLQAGFCAVLSAVTLMAGAGQAQQAASTYRVTQETFGCVAADSEHALTDPAQPARYATPEFKAMFDDGRCVTITPRSRWKLISVEGDLALMSYAGTEGEPGTFFLRIDLLVDPQGHHPAGAADDAVPGTAPAASPQSPPASLTVQQPPSSADPGSSPTALAPPNAGPLLASAPSAPASSPSASIGWALVIIALLVTGVFVVWRIGPATSGGRLFGRSTCKVRLPARLRADAERLAEADGMPLEAFLSSLIAERVGELNARDRRQQGVDSAPAPSAVPLPAISR